MNDTRSILVAHCGARKVSRNELMEIPVPDGTKTYQPLSHYEIVQVLEEALTFRYLKVVKEEYAISADGMKMFGVMDLNAEFSGCRFSIGLRNSNDKSMRLALTAGYRVFVCDNMAFSGDFTPLSHKHTINLQLQDAISIAVDRIYRGFEPLKAKVQKMRDLVLTEQMVKLLIYEAFLDRKIKGIPRQLMPIVHDHYFNPKHDAFVPRNMWSLSNAFTSAFKKLTPVKQFEVTARLGSFLAEAQGEFSPRPTSVAVPAQMGRIVPFGEPRPVMTIGANLAAPVSQANGTGANSDVIEIDREVEPAIDDEETVENYPWGDANIYYDEETEINNLEKLEEEMDKEFIAKAM